MECIVNFICQKRIKWLKWRLRRNKVWFDYAVDVYNCAKIDGTWDDGSLQLLEWKMNRYENKMCLCSAKIFYLTEKEMSKKNDKK